jgi:hypothetical protein
MITINKIDKNLTHSTDFSLEGPYGCFVAASLSVRSLADCPLITMISTLTS